MQFWRGTEIVVGNMGMSELVCSVCVAGSRHKLSAGAYASAAVCRWTLNPVLHVLQLPQERVCSVICTYNQHVYVDVSCQWCFKQCRLLADRWFILHVQRFVWYVGRKQRCYRCC